MLEEYYYSSPFTFYNSKNHISQKKLRPLPVLADFIIYICTAFGFFFLWRIFTISFGVFSSCKISRYVKPTIKNLSSSFMVHTARSFLPDKSCAATRILLCGPPLPPKPSVLRRRDACWQSPYHISRWPAATPWAFSAFVLRSDLDLAIVIDLCASRAWWSHYSSKWVNVMPKVGH